YASGFFFFGRFLVDSVVSALPQTYRPARRAGWRWSCRSRQARITEGDWRRGERDRANDRCCDSPARRNRVPTPFPARGSRRCVVDSGRWSTNREPAGGGLGGEAANL